MKKISEIINSIKEWLICIADNDVIDNVDGVDILTVCYNNIYTLWISDNELKYNVKLVDTIFYSKDEAIAYYKEYKYKLLNNEMEVKTYEVH